MKMSRALAAQFFGGLVLALTLAACSWDDVGGGGGDDNNGSASLRVLNVSPGYRSLDLYADNGDDAEELELEGVAFGAISDYATVNENTYSLKLRRNGVTSTLVTLGDAKLVDDSHTVVVAYGSTGHFGAVVFNEDESEAEAGESKVLLVNTGEAGPVDMYLTAADIDLEDATPQFSNVAHGAAASALIIDSGAYRLRVTGAGNPTDVRLDLPAATFTEKQVMAVVLTATEGGVLVNAMLLPQQGSLSAQPNSKARIRGAVGIASGTAVTAKVGSAAVLSSAGVGVMGSRYTQLEAGTASVALTVDGAAVSVPDVTLKPGADYTLLVWSNASGVQTTLIGDDNRLPTTSGKAKLRLINGVSGLEVPVSLAVDYAPIVEGVSLGQASISAEVDGGLEYQFDVTDTDTGSGLFTRAGTTLQTGSVYTMLMHGGGTRVVGSTLRKDR